MPSTSTLVSPSTSPLVSSGAMGIPENIKALRVREGLSQPELAKRAGVSQQLISQLENGKNTTTKKLPQIARALNASISDIDPAFGTDPGNTLIDVPVITWVSAGEMQETIVDLTEFPTVPAANLPAGDWIALRVGADNNSMNKISPPESVIFVNRKDKRLVANGCYVIADEQGRATYKRYRPNEKPPFQPASYDNVKPPKLEGAISVVGRVRRSIIEL